MLNSVIAADKGIIDVKVEDSALTISESLSLGWQLELPRASQLSEMRNMAFSKVSIPETMAYSVEAISGMFVEQRDLYLRKFKRFSKSSTYLNRLASLNAMIGDIDKAVALWDDAYENERDSYFHQKVLSAYIANGRIGEAAKRIKADAKLVDNKIPGLHESFISLAQGDVESASKYTESLLQQEEGAGLNTLILAGALAYIQKEYERAVFFCREALRQRDTSSVLYVNLALAYQKLGERRKCANALRKAVALGPLNRTAILFYADILHDDKKDIECIGVLQRYLKYDQKDVAVLDRLARALFATNDFKRSLETLKLRAGIKPESTVWNNIGVAYFRLNDNTRAKQYYAKALDGLDFGAEELWLPFTNLLVVLRHEQDFRVVVNLTEKALLRICADRLAEHPVAFKVIVSHLVALSMLDRSAEAMALAEQLLGKKDIFKELRYELLMFATSYYSYLKGDRSRASDMASVALHAATESEGMDPKVRMYLFNNAAFAFLESNRIEDAERALSRITCWIHKEACPTATLGLLDIRRGKVDKGEELYREAMQLSTDKMLTIKIKQKLGIELAKVNVEKGNYEKAQILLKRVIARKGERALGQQAVELLKNISK